MKLKIRFEQKDMIKFCIFAVVLFFLVAIAVSNIVYLGKEGALYGFSPRLALFEGYFKETLGLFVIALICLVASCKDYFFEFDKGFGFTTEKKSDGYSHWCSDRDMKKELKMINATDLKTDVGGVVLINNGRQLWVDDSEYHNLIIGSTGSGKTQTVIFPMVHTLSKHGESMIITDPKGEIYEQTSEMLRRKGYNIVLLNFRNPGQGNAWNPLTLPYKLWKSGNQDKAIELLDDLALNILYDESSKNSDPFWEKTSADYFSGLALGLFEDAPEEQININSISLMSTVGEDKVVGGSTYIKEYFNTKDPTGSAYINASSTILAPSDTKGGIIAVFKQKIKLFASRVNLSEMLSYSDFSIEDIGRKKTAVFIVIQDEKKTYHSLATILIKQFYETLIDVAQSHGGKLPIRTNFLLDEFANMPPLKDVTTMITAARSRAMRFTMIIQNFAQLNEVYGEQNAETIKGNCGNTIYLISTEFKALEEISKMCGEVKSKKDDKTVSTPLITISDLQKLKMFEVIVRRLRMPPYRTKLTPNFKMNWGKTYPKVDLFNIPFRKKREVQVFNVKEFVDKKRKERNMLAFGQSGNGVGGALPYSGRGAFNGSLPFGEAQNFDNLFNSVSNNRPNSQPLNDLLKNDDTSMPKLDMEDIISKIDAKIAELEKSELENNDNSLDKKIPNIFDKDESSENKSQMAEIIEDEDVRKTNNGNISELVEQIDETKDDDKIDNVNNSDDEYYDDFYE